MDLAEDSPVRELLNQLNRDIGQEETRLRTLLDQLWATPAVDANDEDRRSQKARRLHQDFHLRVSPLRQHREYIIQQIATLKSYDPVTMIIPA